jgi:predicted exporter
MKSLGFRLKGSMWIWGAFIITLFVFSFIYLLFQNVNQQFLSLNISDTSESLLTQSYSQNQEVFKNVLNYYPFFVLIVSGLFVLYAIWKERGGE